MALASNGHLTCGESSFQNKTVLLSNHTCVEQVETGEPSEGNVSCLAASPGTLGPVLAVGQGCSLLFVPTLVLAPLTDHQTCKGCWKKPGAQALQASLRGVPPSLPQVCFAQKGNALGRV